MEIQLTQINFISDIYYLIKLTISDGSVPSQSWDKEKKRNVKLF